MLKFLLCIWIIFAVPLANAIINGQDATTGDFVSKSVVAFQMVEVLPDGSSVFHKASGTVVSKRIILTAAHVVYYYLQNLSSLEIIFELSPEWGADSAGQKRFAVSHAVVHPAFKMTATGTANDLALVELSDDIPTGYLPIPVAGPNSTMPKIGELGLVAGFGTDTDGLPKDGFRLRFTSRPLLEIDGTSMIDAPKFWYEQSTGGFCGGDSGGPAIFNDRGIPSIYGVVAHVTYNSSGQGFCLTKGAFTNVVPFNAWIKATMAEIESKPTQ